MWCVARFCTICTIWKTWNILMEVLLLVKLHAKPATLLKLTILHGCFSRSFNCSYGIKSRKTLHEKFRVQVSILCVFYDTSQKSFLTKKLPGNCFWSYVLGSLLLILNAFTCSAKTSIHKESVSRRWSADKASWKNFTKFTRWSPFPAEKMHTSLDFPISSLCE